MQVLLNEISFFLGKKKVQYNNDNNRDDNIFQQSINGLNRFPRTYGSRRNPILTGKGHFDYEHVIL